MPGAHGSAEIATRAEALGVALGPAASDRLAALTQLLEERAVRRGLVAEGDAGRILDRHVLDSLRAAPLIRGTDRRAYDLGSGAGLPGLVLAIAVPRCHFVLVESKSRRAGFLEFAIDELGIGNAEVAVARAEDMAEPADVATARAFAPLGRSWRVAVPLLRSGGRLVYFAGRGLTDPREAASSVAQPEAPAEVEIARGVATSPPLVIMSRG